MKYRVEHAGKVYEMDVLVHGNACVLRGPDGQAQTITLETRPDGSQRATTPWGELEVLSARRGSEIWAQIAGRRLQAQASRAHPLAAGAAGGAVLGAVCAPMPGRLVRIEVKVGDAVRTGQALAVIEAMKMENELTSPLDGVVTQVLFEAPATVDKGAMIMKVEAP